MPRNFFIATAFIVSAIVLLVPSILKKSGQKLSSSFGRMGRAIVSYRLLEGAALASVCVVLFYGVQAFSLRKDVLATQAQFRSLAASYLEHDYLATAQLPLIQAGSGFQLVGEKHEGDSKVYVTKKPEVPGTFEAKIEGGEADVSWKVDKKTVPQYKLQIGQVKALGDNRMGIALGSGDLVQMSANLSHQPMTDGQLVVTQIVKSGDE